MLMLIDKSYYDYDYEPIPKREPSAPKSKEDVGKVMSKFGFKTNLSGQSKKNKEIRIAERLQREASEIKNR